MVPKIDLARRTFHVHVDDTLRFRCEVRAGNDESAVGTGRREDSTRAEQLLERQRAKAGADAAGNLPEKPAPRQTKSIFFEGIHVQLFVIVASRLRTALETIVHAASSAGSSAASAMRVPTASSNFASSTAAL